MAQDRKNSAPINAVCCGGIAIGMMSVKEQFPPINASVVGSPSKHMPAAIENSVHEFVI